MSLSHCIHQTLNSKASDRKSGSAGMPRPISYAVFCLKKKKKNRDKHTGDRDARRNVVGESRIRFYTTTRCPACITSPLASPHIALPLVLCYHAPLLFAPEPPSRALTPLRSARPPLLVSAPLPFPSLRPLFFFFNDTAPTELYTLSLHDALPICRIAFIKR